MSTWTKSVAPAVVDPYLYWADETLNAYLSGGGGPGPLWIPIIIELNGGPRYTAPNFAAMVAEKSRSWGQAIRVSPLYEAPPAGLETASYCTALVTKAFFEPQILEDSDLRKFIQRFEIGLPVPGYATPAPKKTKPPVPKKKKKKKKALHTVVTAVIDDGMGFAHELFRQGALSTRVEYFWNQDAAPEMTRTGIDNAIAWSDHGGIVDEDELYAATGNLDYTQPGHKPIAQRAAHGTHVMDIACGERPSIAIPWRPVIGVQLPVATTADTSGATLTPQALDAFWYILNRADSILAPPARVVINLSYGTIAGPHDGSSILEKAIDEMILLRNDRLRVVLPAGNSYLARCHARFDLAKGKEQVLRWRVQPDDRTPSFQEIWLPKATTTVERKVELKIIPPYGEESGWIQEGEEHVWQPGTDLLCKALYLLPGSARPRSMIFIALAPTATLDPTRDVAPSGTWRIRIRNRASRTATIDAWIQRDDTPFGYPRRGRQSRFDDGDYVVRDPVSGREVEVDNKSHIKRAGTINAIATGDETIVLGGFRRSDRVAAKYSAAGSRKTSNGGVAIRGPDAMTASDDSAAAGGVLAAGSRSRSVVAINGTSVAAPQVTRWVAKRMAAGRPSGRAAVKAQATPANPPIPQRRGGAGLIDFPPRVDRQIAPRRQ
jgi:hypothetical protein